MGQLVDCAECGGWLRADSGRCPHCGIAAPHSLRRTWLTALGLGALAACSAGMQGLAADGGPDAGDGGSSSFLAADGGDGGPSYYVGADAYGIGPFFDGGWEPPASDAGTPDAGSEPDAGE